MMKLSQDLILTPKGMSSFEGIVLDVDNTLIYAVEEEDESEIKEYPLLEHHHISIMKRRGDVTGINIYLRPNVREFLSILCSQYKVGIWSLGQPEYVSAIAEVLDVGTQTFNVKATNKCHFIYNWTHAYRQEYKIFKPLRLSPFKNIKTLIIEDNISVCEAGDPYIIVPSFEGESNDTILKGLLHSMCKVQCIPI